jgi:hypothetical protein
MWQVSGQGAREGSAVRVCSVWDGEPLAGGRPRRIQRVGSAAAGEYVVCAPGRAGPIASSSPDTLAGNPAAQGGLISVGGLLQRGLIQLCDRNAEPPPQWLQTIDLGSYKAMRRGQGAEAAWEPGISSFPARAGFRRVAKV